MVVVADFLFPIIVIPGNLTKNTPFEAALQVRLNTPFYRSVQIMHVCHSLPGARIVFAEFVWRSVQLAQCEPHHCCLYTMQHKTGISMIISLHHLFHRCIERQLFQSRQRHAHMYADGKSATTSTWYEGVCNYCFLMVQITKGRSMNTKMLVV